MATALDIDPSDAGSTPASKVSSTKRRIGETEDAPG